jgi:hypothetical protein
MKATQKLLLWAMVAACGCLDLKLIDEMLLADAGTAFVEDNGNPNEDNGNPNSENSGGITLPVPDPNDTEPPILATPNCAATELSENQICIAEGPISASFRFVTDEQAQVSLVIEGSGRTGVLSEPWSTEHHVAVTELEPPFSSSVTLIVEDINENKNEFDISVTGQDGPTIAITEVLADPNGSEPAQEFIEIMNFGPYEINLSGWMIDDNGDANGNNNLIADNTLLEPGQVAIVVSASYNPQDGQDPAPDSSALIIVLDSTVCSNGLKNSEAETVELYDAAGRLVSQYLGQAGNPKEGCSAMRLKAELPDGDKLAFGLEPTGNSTPGQAPVL